MATPLATPGFTRLRRRRMLRKPSAGRTAAHPAHPPQFGPTPPSTRFSQANGIQRANIALRDSGGGLRPAFAVGELPHGLPTSGGLRRTTPARSERRQRAASRPCPPPTALIRRRCVLAGRTTHRCACTPCPRADRARREACLTRASRRPAGPLDNEPRRPCVHARLLTYDGSHLRSAHQRHLPRAAPTLCAPRGERQPRRNECLPDQPFREAIESFSVRPAEDSRTHGTDPAPISTRQLRMLARFHQCPMPPSLVTANQLSHRRSLIAKAVEYLYRYARLRIATRSRRPSEDAQMLVDPVERPR